MLSPLLLTVALQTSGDDLPATCYLFSYFLGNGEDGLHLAWSRDGYRFTALGGGRSYLQPVVGKSKLMRDPCLTIGPDQRFHLVWTIGWAEQIIGYASSPDLLTWSEQRALPVMAHEPTAENCWAPEVVWDEAAGEYVIFWSTTIPGRFDPPALPGDSNHRLFATRTTDFRTFTPTELFFDPGYNLIDGNLLQADGRPLAVDGRYYLFFKEETKLPAPAPPKRQLRLATGPSPQGPFGQVSEPFTRHGVEGACAIRIGDHYLVYYDIHVGGGYGLSRSADLVDWTDLSEQLEVPAGARHGTVIPVDAAVIWRVLAAGE